MCDFYVMIDNYYFCVSITYSRFFAVRLSRHMVDWFVILGSVRFWYIVVVVLPV